MPFFLTVLFAQSRLFPANNEEQYSSWKKEIKLFYEEKSLFFKEILFVNCFVISTFSKENALFSSQAIEIVPKKKRYGDSKTLSKEVGCGWQVGVFRSGWRWGSLPSAAGF